MARSLRMYGKKRGNRRTGSKMLGTAGEAIFFACMLAIGGVVLMRLAEKVIIPEWKANRTFLETTCFVERTRAPVRQHSDGPRYVPEVLIAYEVEGRRLQRWTYDIATVEDVRLIRSSDESVVKALVEPFKVGGQYPCWYDPADPRVAVLVRGYTWWLWSLLLLPLAFLGVGGAGLVYTIVHWGKSPEHQAATLLRARAIDLFENGAPAGAKYPYIPRPENLKNSPGTTLAYRLPIHTSQGWRLFSTAAACAIWNGLVAIFVIRVVRNYLAGEMDWLLAVFVIPFAAAGLWLVVHFLRQLLVTTGVGPTQVEISDHPLLPGSRYALFVSQSGRMTVRSFEVRLVCEEEASYHQGTDIRIERRRVYDQQLFGREAFEIQPQAPFEEQFDLELSPHAMHSFQAAYNEVQWKLVVRGDVENWPPYERYFPLVVYPRDPAVEAS